MKTKKQREHQKVRRNRKRAERWERDVAMPQFVTAMLRADTRIGQMHIEYVYMKRANPMVRYRNRTSILRALEWVSKWVNGKLPPHPAGLYPQASPTQAS